MNTNNFTQEEIAAIERICKTGALQAMDKVEIVGLTSVKGRNLNGRIATVNAINGNENDVRSSNPYLAQFPDGRYKVTVEYVETRGKEVRPGIFSSTGESKTYSLKRENIYMHSIGPGTIARDPEGLAILRKYGMNVSSTAEGEAADPETAGFFPAILQGDTKRAREILEVIKSRGCPDPGNQILDATGDAALLGGINDGHAEIVKLLLEYGGNPNQVCNVPMMREYKITYFNMAILMFDLIASKDNQGSSAEEIVNALLDGGGDVHAMALARGTPLSSAVKIKSDHAARMRIAKKILDRGADPNRIIRIDGQRNETLVLFSACVEELGKYSTTERLEMVQLLVDGGADPGKFVKMEARYESCNAIHCVVSHKDNDALSVLLSSEKGRAAINAKRIQRCNTHRENSGNGETAITMCVSCDNLELYKASRDMAVQLLKAGADIDIEDHIGLSAKMWLEDRHPHKPHAKKKELDGLVKKAKTHGPAFWDSDEVKAFKQHCAV